MTSISNGSFSLQCGNEQITLPIRPSAGPGNSLQREWVFSPGTFQEYPEAVQIINSLLHERINDYYCPIEKEDSSPTQKDRALLVKDFQNLMTHHRSYSENGLLERCGDASYRLTKYILSIAIPLTRNETWHTHALNELD